MTVYLQYTTKFLSFQRNNSSAKVFVLITGFNCKIYQASTSSDSTKLVFKWFGLCCKIEICPNFKHLKLNCSIYTNQINCPVCTSETYSDRKVAVKTEKRTQWTWSMNVLGKSYSA